jgi:hypothetical protein
MHCQTQARLPVSDLTLATASSPRSALRHTMKSVHPQRASSRAVWYPKPCTRTGGWGGGLRMELAVPQQYSTWGQIYGIT